MTLLPVTCAGRCLVLTGLAEADNTGSVDFLHSRLAPPLKPAIDRRIVWGAIIGLVLLLVGLFALHEQHVNQAELDREAAKYTAMRPTLKTATSEVEKIEYARHWQGGTPRYIACLRDLTNAMPDDGETYLTSFDLHENMEGTLSGKTGLQRRCHRRAGPDESLQVLQEADPGDQRKGNA